MTQKHRHLYCIMTQASNVDYTTTELSLPYHPPHLLQITFSTMEEKVWLCGKAGHCRMGREGGEGRRGGAVEEEVRGR